MHTAKLDSAERKIYPLSKQCYTPLFIITAKVGQDVGCLHGE
jgi:hypothetical protein